MTCTHNFLLFSYSILIFPSFILASSISMGSIITAVNSKRTTWVAGRNQETELILETLLRTSHLLRNSIRSPLIEEPLRPPLPPKGEAVDIAHFPTAFDARTRWKFCRNILENVKNQGRCDSSWAISVASVISDRICIESNATYRVQISPQDLFECCETNCSISRSDRCTGGYASAGFQHWINEGLVTEACKPYQETTQYYRKLVQCERKCANSTYWKPYSFDKYYGNKWYVILPKTNDVAIMTEIMMYGPVVAYIALAEDIWAYKAGVYTHVAGGWIGRHFVKILGWGKWKGIDYWLCINSWGKRWGSLGGFFKILKGQNHCMIESYVLGARLYPEGSLHDIYGTQRKAKHSLGNVYLAMRKFFYLVLMLFYVI